MLATTESVLGPELERGLLPGTLRGRDERELQSIGVVVARQGITGRVDGGTPGPERDESDRELVHPVGPDEGGDLGVGEGREEPGREAGRVREGEELGEHRAGVPVDVAEAALPVAPARAPGNSRHDDGDRVAGGRRSYDDEGVILRVIPVQARLEAVDGGAPGHGDVELEREAGARRPRGAEEHDPAVGPGGASGDSGRQVEQACETGAIERGGGHPGRAGKDGGGRRG